MPNIFCRTKRNSVLKLNGRTPKWFRDWHGSEFMEIKLRITGLLWLVGMMTVAAFSVFGIILADYLGR